MAHLEEYASIFLAWWVVPLTLGAFWLRYLWRHEWLGTWLHIGLIVLSVATASLFYRLHARTLRGIKRTAFPWLRFYRDRRTYQTVAVAVIGLALVIGSVGAIEGLTVTSHYDINVGEIPCWARANLWEAELSTKPLNYWSLDGDIRDDAVIGANLRGADLCYAEMERTFLVNADLRYADLRGSNMWSANLRHAQFDSANLLRANLESSDLTLASLMFAHLELADVSNATLDSIRAKRADFTGAILWEAKLRGGWLPWSVFNGALLSYADLTGADLSDAEFLYQEQLDQACGDTLTTILPSGLTIKQCPEK